MWMTSDYMSGWYSGATYVHFYPHYFIGAVLGLAVSLISTTIYCSAKFFLEL
jgi:uncharacterized membrane protein